MIIMDSKARITAQGAYIPSAVLTNEDLEKIVDTDDEWIVSRTGIKERRISEKNEQTSDLAYRAVIDLTNKYGSNIKDVDFIIVCTLTPDFKTPSVSSYIQYKLGIDNAGAIDINAACAGFTYGLYLANSLITSGVNKKILVIGTENLSKITDYTDRTTCILFGDGAGAFLVEKDEKNPSFISVINGSNGSKGKNLYASNIGSILDGSPIDKNGLIKQNGREVYKWAVSTLPKKIKELSESCDLNIRDIDWFIPHSANLRMLESICERADIDKNKLLTSIRKTGNTSSASIPLSINLATQENKLINNQKIMLFGFGGGLAYSGLIINWNLDKKVN